MPDRPVYLLYYRAEGQEWRVHLRHWLDRRSAERMEARVRGNGLSTMVVPVSLEHLPCQSAPTQRAHLDFAYLCRDPECYCYREGRESIQNDGGRS